MSEPSQPQPQAMQDFEVALRQAELIAQGRFEEAGLGPRPVVVAATPGTPVDPNALAQSMAAERNFNNRLQALRNSNPLIAIVEGHERTRRSEATTMGEDNARTYYECRLEEMRQNARIAVEEDRVNQPQRELSQQSMIQQLMSGNIGGMLMDFIKMIPGIGGMVSTAMSVPGEMLQGAMSGNANLDVAANFGQVTRRNNLRSAFMGATGNNQLSAGVNDYINSVITPAASAPQASQPAASPPANPAPADNLLSFDGPNGGNVPAPVVPPVSGPQPPVRGVR